MYPYKQNKSGIMSKIEVHHYHHGNIQFENIVLDKLREIYSLIYHSKKEEMQTLDDIASAQAAEDIEIQDLLAAYQNLVAELAAAQANGDQTKIAAIIADAQDKTASITALLAPPASTPVDGGTPTDGGTTAQ